MEQSEVQRIRGLYRAMQNSFVRLATAPAGTAEYVAASWAAHVAESHWRAAYCSLSDDDRDEVLG